MQGLFLVAAMLLHGVVKHFFTFRGKLFCIDLQLRQQVDEGIDAAFEREKFIEHYHLSFFQYAKAALKVAALETHDVAGFFNQLFNFVECGLVVFHSGAKVITVFTAIKWISRIWGFEKVQLPTSTIEKSGKEVTVLQHFNFLVNLKDVGYHCVSGKQLSFTIV